jgi:hypothetical protein
MGLPWEDATDGEDGPVHALLGPLRFVNHDCDAKCLFETHPTGNVPYVKAARRIEVGEELTIRYGKNYFTNKARVTTSSEHLRRESDICRCRKCSKKSKLASAPTIDEMDFVRNAYNIRNCGLSHYNEVIYQAVKDCFSFPPSSDDEGLVDAQVNASNLLKSLTRNIATLDAILSDGDSIPSGVAQEDSPEITQQWPLYSHDGLLFYLQQVLMYTRRLPE